VPRLTVNSWGKRAGQSTRYSILFLRRSRWTPTFRADNAYPQRGQWYLRTFTLLKPCIEQLRRKKTVVKDNREELESESGASSDINSARYTEYTIHGICQIETSIVTTRSIDGVRSVSLGTHTCTPSRSPSAVPVPRRHDPPQPALGGYRSQKKA
jgi:hypothetical protein